jgi:hypothetical protein
VAIKDRSYPVVAGEHFASDLGIAGLVGAKQPDGRETEEEEKRAKSREQKKLADAVLTKTHGG